ncbi:hypothetical protein TIFTF001_033535 [Ficus carica]|uniref:Uncharacterized protein n=1 Tax=Ficus carica TaxID=3494 RepID=A0AA88DYG2_FICCA|nr:hypothetical protein TIFTF001_033535 [Ficus carica]
MGGLNSHGTAQQRWALQHPRPGTATLPCDPASECAGPAPLWSG